MFLYIREFKEMQTLQTHLRGEPLSTRIKDIKCAKDHCQLEVYSFPDIMVPNKRLQYPMSEDPPYQMPLSEGQMTLQSQSKEGYLMTLKSMRF